MEEMKENMRTILGDTSPQRMMITICYAVQVFYMGTSHDGCMQKMPKQPLVGPNVETVMEVQVIALDMQEVSRHPLVEQVIRSPNSLRLVQVL